MSKMIKAKKIVATLVVCCGLIGARTAEAFVWPCIDITQISSFISSITTGISTITNAVSQVKNIQQTVQAVGNQVSGLRDFMADLRQTIVSVKESINMVTKSIKEVIDEVDETLKMAEDITQNFGDQEKEKSKGTEEEINKNIEENGSKEEAEEILKQAQEDSLAGKKEVEKVYDDAQNNINQTLDDANKSVEMLVSAVNTNENLSQADKDEFNSKADKIKTEIEALKEEANNVLNNLKKEFNEEYENKIANAYDLYSQAIADFYDGKISKEELKQAGSDFKNSIDSFDVNVDKATIDTLVAKTNKIADDIDALQEDMLNSISNEKEYSDEDEQASSEYLTPKIYAFSYTSSKDLSRAKALYSPTAKGKPFLISKEFLCEGRGLTDIEDLKEDSGWFRTCASRAKTELDYYPDAENDPLYQAYDRNGVYDHILQDYSAANIVSISKAKQFVTSWRGIADEKNPDKAKEAEYYQLKELISKSEVDSASAAMGTISTIELWAPRLWSELRRVDAITNAKNVVKEFQHQDTLYIDGREDNEIVADALNHNKGTIKGEGPKDKKIFSNVLLEICGIDAKKISLEPGNTEAKGAEDAFKDCLKIYAEGISFGGDKGSLASEEDKKEWRIKQRQTTNDALFENLTMATITNYNSTRDYMPTEKLENGEINIVKLQDVYKTSKDAREHLSISAQINYYSTQQLLNIIDTEAVNLQAEILKDLAMFDYSYFPEDE